MIIRWLKVEDLDFIKLEGRKENWIVDDMEILSFYKRFPHYCYGAEIDGKLVGTIIGYGNEKSAWISNFLVKKEFRGEGIGKRLFSTVFNALTLDYKTVFLHAAKEIVPFYEKFGFVNKCEVVRVQRKHSNKTYRFSSKKQKDLESLRDITIVKKLDNKIYKENRNQLIDYDLKRKSTQIFTSPNGFMYSKVIDKYVFIGPWEVRSGAYYDSENMMRAILHTRKKPMIAELPKPNSDALELYLKYGFEVIGESVQMNYGEQIALDYEEIYSFATTGTNG